jgi:hypothetical protein
MISSWVARVRLSTSRERTDAAPASDFLRGDGSCHTIPYMHKHMAVRSQPRVPMTTLCSEIVGDKEQFAFVVDLSEQGLRLERPLRGRAPSRIVQLELTLPNVDEIIWAKGEICFDLYGPPARHSQAAAALRISGVRLVAAATRHLRLVRDYVRAAVESANGVDLLRASHFGD